jgi:acetolactate synthase I/II/III large subunit
MIRLTDYVAQTLADKGVRHVFMITGGGAMHLNDSLGHEPRLSVICNHHEQASAMAAEGYARVTNRLAVVNVTSGPGGINALNGVFGAWVDSIPMLVISGQVKRETLMATYSLPGLRQIGDQEADIIGMVKGITKYSVLVTDPVMIRYHLDKAVHLATSGRPGPCWLDIPIDVQASRIDPAGLPAYDPAEDEPGCPLGHLPSLCRDIVVRLQAAKRPVILAGKGIRLADALEPFEKVIRKLKIPVATAWTALDLMASDDPLYCGRPGDVGDRAGNFCVQNSDVLLAIGSRLNIRQVSHNWGSFARCAYKISVDADPAELNKPTVKPDLPVHCDARIFLEELDRQIGAAGFVAGRHAGWLAWCKERMARYPVVLPRHRVFKGRFINPYHFVDRLFGHLAADDVVVCANGAANVVTFQAAPLRKGQRLWANTGCASMGYDLPAAIGAAVARGNKRVICLAGDGSLQQNIQELQTIRHHQWPIKIFVLNNGGYLSIRTTQGSYFNRFVGESPRSGVSFPDIIGVARAYGLPAYRAEGKDFETVIDEALGAPGPALCEVMLDPSQSFEPKLSSKVLPDGSMISSPLEDMYPFLEKKELEENLLIPPWRS